jgi:hypothetical protein
MKSLKKNRSRNRSRNKSKKKLYKNSFKTGIARGNTDPEIPEFNTENKSIEDSRPQNPVFGKPANITLLTVDTYKNDPNFEDKLFTIFAGDKAKEAQAANKSTATIDCSAEYNSKRQKTAVSFKSRDIKEDVHLANALCFYRYLKTVKESNGEINLDGVVVTTKQEKQEGGTLKTPINGEANWFPMKPSDYFGNIFDSKPKTEDLEEKLEYGIQLTKQYKEGLTKLLKNNVNMHEIIGKKRKTPETKTEITPEIKDLGKHLIEINDQLKQNKKEVDEFIKENGGKVVMKQCLSYSKPQHVKPPQLRLKKSDYEKLIKEKESNGELQKIPVEPVFVPSRSSSPRGFDDTASGITVNEDIYFLKEILKQINKKYDK